MPKVTPLKAIRRFCLHCTGDSPKEVKDCSAGNGNQEYYQCPIYPYRLGYKPKEKAMLTPLKAIKKHCFDCCGDSYKEVRNCSGKTIWGDLPQCPLYSYRLGKRGLNEALEGSGQAVNSITPTVEVPVLSSVMQQEE